MEEYKQRLSEIMKAVEQEISNGVNTSTNHVLLELSSVLLGLTEEIQGGKFKEIHERINSYITERTNEILAGKTPSPLLEGGRLIIHVIPLESFDPNLLKTPIDISTFKQTDKISLKPLYGSSWGDAFDGEGFYVNSALNGSYLRILNNGVLEVVDSGMLARVSGQESIPTGIFEQRIATQLKVYLSVLSDIGVSLPCLIKISIHGIAGYVMGVDRSRYFGGERKFEKNNLFFSDLMLEDFNIDLPKLLKPVYDQLWQAGGWNGSLNYDDQGSWIGGNAY